MQISPPAISHIDNNYFILIEPALGPTLSNYQRPASPLKTILPGPIPLFERWRLLAIGVLSKIGGLQILEVVILLP